jgi:hypothetical protein
MIFGLFNFLGWDNVTSQTQGGDGRKIEAPGILLRICSFLVGLYSAPNAFFLHSFILHLHLPESVDFRNRNVTQEGGYEVL